MRYLKSLFLLLVIVGGVNWLLVGLFKIDLVASVTGDSFGQTSACRASSTPGRRLGHRPAADARRMAPVGRARRLSLKVASSRRTVRPALPEERRTPDFRVHARRPQNVR